MIETKGLWVSEFFDKALVQALTLDSPMKDWIAAFTDVRYPGRGFVHTADMNRHAFELSSNDLKEY